MVDGGVGRVREVYVASYRRLVGQLTGVTGDPLEAEDVVMEAFARAVTRHREFAPGRQPRGLAAHGGRQRGPEPVAPAEPDAPGAAGAGRG